MIKSENGLLRAYIQLNVRGRDEVGFDLDPVRSGTREQDHQLGRLDAGAVEHVHPWHLPQPLARQCDASDQAGAELHAVGSQQRTQLIRLRRDMKEAVENENYERASQLRDDIRRIETEKNS